MVSKTKVTGIEAWMDASVVCCTVQRAERPGTASSFSRKGWFWQPLPAEGLAQRGPIWVNSVLPWAATIEVNQITTTGESAPAELRLVLCYSIAIYHHTIDEGELGYNTILPINGALFQNHDTVRTINYSYGKNWNFASCVVGVCFPRFKRMNEQNEMNEWSESEDV